MRWKRVVWPDAWYQWLSQHGGSMYIFFSEQEERKFQSIQQRFAARRVAVQSIQGDQLHVQQSAEDELCDAVPAEQAKQNQGRNIITSVTQTITNFMRSAENRIIDSTAEFLEVVEEKILNAFQSRSLKPFFNLELAIDCYNLSWEAYGVRTSRGDEMITTGVNVNLPLLAAISDTVRTRCCKCLSDSETDETTQETLSSPMHSVVRDTPTIVTTSSNRLPNISQPRIDVEQYGFEQIAVFEKKNVQVVISRLNREHARHRKKPFRIMVAFRGTDNFNNAKQDLRIRRVTWEEVESSLWQATTGNRESPKQH
jgi:hypothetical protein